MSSFSVEWLRLRESLDDRARAVELTWGFGRALPARPALIDLGAGTGANVRHLAHKIGRATQDWTLIERDLTLMTRAPAEMKRWAERSGLDVAEQRRGLRISGDDLTVSVEMRISDLSSRLADLGLGGRDGITANALFDLVSRRWLDLLGAELGAAGFPPLLATTIIDGRLSFTPSDPDDALVMGRFAEHQRRDKGFGPALGGEAPLALVEVLRNAGYRLDTARSDWRVGPRHKAALLLLLDGYQAAAAEQDPAEADRIAAWAGRRRLLGAAGGLEIMVGHADLLATR